MTIRNSMSACISHWAAERPDATAMEGDGERISYAALDAEATRWAKALAGAGLRTGDRVAWFGLNTVQYFTMFVACDRAGLVIAPIGWRLTAPEVNYMLTDQQAPLLVTDPQFLPVAQKAAEGVTTLRHIVVNGIADGAPALSDWIAAQPEGELPPQDTALGVLQLYTSGTTGNPKGAVLTNDNLFANKIETEGDPTMDWIDMEPGDKLLCIMPIAHIAGSGIGAIGFYTGGEVMVRPMFTPDTLFDAVEAGLTQFFLVPTALQMIVQHPRAATTDFSGIKAVTYGAAPIPLELLKACVKLMPNAKFAQQYGMTETTGTVCYLPPADHVAEGNERMKGIGIPLPGVKMKVVDEKRGEVPPGTIGEIAVLSTLNMLHYFNNPAKTAETKDAEGWIYTGDAGTMDADGYFYLKDRIKDMIVTGAENVYPAEVESVMFGHPQIGEVAVIGVPDEKWGEAVKAVVSPAPGLTKDQVDGEAIREWTRERLAGFKVPKSIDVIDELPKNANGKILRRALRDPYWAGMERQVN